MPFILALDWSPTGACADRLARALAPLQRAGARHLTLPAGPQVAAASVRWPRPTDSPSNGAAISIPPDSAPTNHDSAFGVHRDGDLILLLDGNVTDGPSTPAELARRFRERGIAGLEECDGSYVLAVVEPDPPRAWIINDRGGSRSLFVAWNDAGLLVAPELKCFHHDAALRGDLVPAAVLSMVLNCYQFDEWTYWQNVRFLGPARRLHAEAGRVTLLRYWQPRFNAEPPPSVDEYVVALANAVSTHLRRFNHPILALSGGVDSRSILAAVRRAGLRIPSITWSYVERDPPGSDFEIAGRLAAHCDIPNRRRHLRWESLHDDAPALVEASDGLVGHLGAFADRRALAEELAADHDAIFFGDECYRGESACHDATGALEGIGIAPDRGPLLRRAARLLLNRDAAPLALDDYRAKLACLLDSVGPGLAPQDLHDRLYWQVRLSRLLAGPRAIWRRYLDAVSPLLAAPLINLAFALPPDLRVKKRFLRDGLRHLDPALADLPFATVSSRVKWRDILRQAGPFQKYLVETLLDPLPCFDEWINRFAVESGLRTAMSRSLFLEPAPAGGLLIAARRRVSSLLMRGLFRPPLFLSLLTLKLWFSSLRNVPSTHQPARHP